MDIFAAKADRGIVTGDALKGVLLDFIDGTADLLTHLAVGEKGLHCHLGILSDNLGGDVLSRRDRNCGAR